MNWLFALREGGRFVLRYDDTDRERSTAEFAQAIGEDLAWLGIHPHESFRQSERIAQYDAAAERLRAAGLLYPCYETADELERRRGRARALGRPPTIDLASLSDPVLIRADGTYLYTLPSIVDDIASGITHVIRGEDHVANTAVQLAIFTALEATPPVFAHHNLLTTVSGEGLSKRKGALSLRSLREAGFEPMAVASLAVLSGTSHAIEPAETMAALADMVSLADVSRSAAKFNPDDLRPLNARLVHRLPFDAVADRLQALGIGGGAAFWEAVRENCETVGDAARWWRAISDPQALAVEPEDADYLVRAAELLPPDPR
eukprot:jgi/Tetstr1/463755/TSEL_000804.t1